VCSYLYYKTWKTRFTHKITYFLPDQWLK
jgi:hypothetical protein